MSSAYQGSCGCHGEWIDDKTYDEYNCPQHQIKAGDDKLMTKVEAFLFTPEDYEQEQYEVHQKDNTHFVTKDSGKRTQFNSGMR